MSTWTDIEAGREAMQALLSAYRGRETKLPNLDLRLHPLVFQGVNATLVDSDQRWCWRLAGTGSRWPSATPITSRPISTRAMPGRSTVSTSRS